MNSKISQISKIQIPYGEAVQGKELREGIFEFIKAGNPDFDVESFISVTELNQLRRMYLTSLITQEKGELEALNRDVIYAIQHNSVLSENIREEPEARLTFGQKIADHIAVFGGSWTFIISFFLFIFLWIGINLWVLSKHPIDPYPFILLNLILSCLAAIQAPIIMMSQNRQEQKDRKRNEHDYKINLKAELEINLLNDKIDHLMIHQNKKLLEIQEIQMDYMEEIMKAIKKNEI